MRVESVKLAVALALGASLTTAAAVARPEHRALSCPTGPALACVKLMSAIAGPASTFCHGFLKTSTVTTTVTPTSTVTTVTVQPNVKRTADIEDRALTLPAALLAFATPILSSACTCFGVTASTTTTTSTAPPILATQTVTACLGSGVHCYTGVNGGGPCPSVCCNQGYYNCGANLFDNIFCCI